MGGQLARNVPKHFNPPPLGRQLPLRLAGGPEVLMLQALHRDRILPIASLELSYGLIDPSFPSSFSQRLGWAAFSSASTAFCGWVRAAFRA